jgi:biopolymer transport protein ExbD
VRFTRPHVVSRNFRFVSLLALFNCLLILLIFVLFLPVFSNPTGLSVVLPQAITGEPLSHKDITVIILKNDTIYLDSKNVSQQELSRFVKASQDKMQQVLIKVDHRASVGALVRVWDIFRQAGVFKVNIATNE